MVRVVGTEDGKEEGLEMFSKKKKKKKCRGEHLFCLFGTIEQFILWQDNELKNTLSYFEKLLMISSLNCFIRCPSPQLYSQKYTLLKDDEKHKLANAEISDLLFTQLTFWIHIQVQ